MRGLLLVWVCLTRLFCGAAEPPAEGETAAPVPPKRARVVRVQDAEAMVRFSPQLARVCGMVEGGLTRLTGKPTPKEAWLSLVSTQDAIGIKVFSRPGATSGTRPAVVEAVVKGLLDAGVPQRQILVWDQHLSDLRLAGFFDLADRYGIRVAGSAEAGYDQAKFYETPLLGQLVWGDLEFGKTGAGVGRKSFVSKLMTNQMTKIISITPLLNHNLVGVSGHLIGLALGSVDNTLRFESSATRLADAIPEILVQSELIDRLALNITDALICQYEGEERQLLHYSTVLNQLWFSTDPVALDVLALEALERQQRLGGIASTRTATDLYENASLMQLGVSNPKQIDVIGP
jgi:hypothetical protein